VTVLAVLQPGYLPWLGFFDQMRRADVFVYYDDVQFDKHGWRNRNRIKTAQGVAWLTVPVYHKGRHGQLNRDVEIDNNSDWPRVHVRSLRQAYARANGAAAYLDEFEQLLCARRWERLQDLDLAVAASLANRLGVSASPLLASSLGVPGTRSERLIGLCRRLGADTYLTGDAAAGYLDGDAFRRAGIEVVWQRYGHPVYPQLHGPFVPYLSAIDAVLNLGAGAASLLRDEEGGKTDT